MSNYIDRYVYDVTRRLPEKERDEVSRELNGNIYDMLPENPGEDEIKRVLLELGSPAELAEKYRQSPRYVISPAVYDDYVRVLGWVLPLVGIVVFAVGMVAEAVGAIKDGIVSVPASTGGIIAAGLDGGVSAVFTAFAFITLGFMIAERVGAESSRIRKREWKLEDLPEVIPNSKGRIPLSDSIAELAITLIFSVVAILVCAGAASVAFSVQDGETQILQLFSSGFLSACIPAIVVMALLAALVGALKIKVRRWTPLVCGAELGNSMLSMGIMLYLLTRPDMFSAEFLAFLQGLDWGKWSPVSFLGGKEVNAVIASVCAVIIICSVAESAVAVYKTVKYRAK